MSSSFNDPFGEDEVAVRHPVGPFDDDDDDDDDGSVGCDSGLPSQRFDAFSPADDVDPTLDDPSAGGGGGLGFHDVAVRHVSGDGGESFPPSPERYGFGANPHLSDLSAAPSPFSAPETNGNAYGGVDHGEVFASDGPVLPPPGEMEPEEGFLLREWHRQNAILLEEKEAKAKKLRNQIISEAEAYKVEFYEKRKLNRETNKIHNREREKLFLASQEKFYADADKDYWKAIAELIPREIPYIEKKRGKKDQEKKPSIVVIHGPKPGKATDLSRMRQILLKLKYETPPHLKPPPPAPAAKDGAAATQNKPETANKETPVKSSSST